MADKTIPTPSGWKLIATSAGYLSAEYKDAETNSTPYPPTGVSSAVVKEFPGYMQALRQDNADPSVWYLLVGRTADGKTIDDTHTFMRRSIAAPTLPVSFASSSFIKPLLIGVVLGGTGLIIYRLARRAMKKHRRK